MEELFHQLAKVAREFDWFFSIATVLVCYGIWHLFKHARTRGPTVWPVVGALPSIFLNFRELYAWGLGNSLKYGTWKLVLPSGEAFFVTSPANVEHILKNAFSNYPKGPVFQSCLRDLLGSGIFNSDGEVWLTQRKAASYEFAARALRDLVLRASHKEISDRLSPFYENAVGSHGEFDMQEVLIRFNFDNICIVGFGVDPGCLKVGLPKVAFAEAFNAATTASFTRFFLPSRVSKLTKALGIGSEAALRKSMSSIKRFADGIITERSTELALEAKEIEGSPHSDLLSRFMKLQKVQGDTYSHIVLQDVITNFVLAGRDTAAVALVWFFWMLSLHPEVEERILEELYATIQARKTSSAPEKAEAFDGKYLFAYEELKHMPYLHAALSESMRLHPPVPSDEKYVLSDDMLPDGTHLPAGSRVIYDMWSMARLEKVWGPDCLEFKPERWLREGAFVPESPFKYPIFNAGPRTCLGREMAYLIMKSFVASTLLQFKVQVRPSYKPLYKKSFTLHMEEGLPVTLVRRASVAQ